MLSWFILSVVCMAGAVPVPDAAPSQHGAPAALLQPPAADGANVTYAMPECPSRQQEDSTIPAAAAANFVVREFAYMKYVGAPGQIDPLPDTTQVAFALDNSAAAVTTACSFNRATGDGGYAWYPCGDRTIEATSADGNGLQSQYTVKTSARFEWDRSPVSAQAVTTVQPDCQTSDTGSYSIQQCTAPDATIGADLD
ncbi:hypothetical protein PG985_001831 [Apiospora marii]|uniref:AA1-like domain-containing protein n=1 Tax=Apiospora marii TaxID=335849 RepID=A0ABR1RZM2_9PEZI